MLWDVTPQQIQLCPSLRSRLMWKDKARSCRGIQPGLMLIQKHQCCGTEVGRRLQAGRNQQNPSTCQSKFPCTDKELRG